MRSLAFIMISAILAVTKNLTLIHSFCLIIWIFGLFIYIIVFFLFCFHLFVGRCAPSTSRRSIFIKILSTVCGRSFGKIMRFDIILLSTWIQIFTKLSLGLCLIRRCGLLCLLEIWMWSWFCMSSSWSWTICPIIEICWFIYFKISFLAFHFVLILL